MERKQLLTPDELDKLLRYKPGWSERLAKRGKLPHLLLPDGDIRFDAAEIERLIGECARPLKAVKP